MVIERRLAEETRGVLSLNGRKLTVRHDGRGSEPGLAMRGCARDFARGEFKNARVSWHDDYETLKQKMTVLAKYVVIDSTFRVDLLNSTISFTADELFEALAEQAADTKGNGSVIRGQVLTSQDQGLCWNGIATTFREMLGEDSYCSPEYRKIEGGRGRKIEHYVTHRPNTVGATTYVLAFYTDRSQSSAHAALYRIDENGVDEAGRGHVMSTQFIECTRSGKESNFVENIASELGLEIVKRIQVVDLTGSK